MLLKYELKQNIRYRLRLIILLLLLCVVTFFLILQISIYYKSISEINRAKDTYLTVTTIAHKNPDDIAFDNIKNDILNQIRDNPYVLLIDNRRTLAGVNPKLNHVTDKYHNYPEVYIEGKVVNITEKGMDLDIELKVENVIAGKMKDSSDTIHATKYYKDNIIVIGKRYYFILSLNNSKISIENYYNIKDQKKFYDSAYSYAGDVISSNLIFTSSVYSVQAFHKGSVMIKQGRDFNESDYKAGRVCLISEEYAKENGLAIGNKVDFHMIHGIIRHKINSLNCTVYSTISSRARQQQTINPDLSDSPKDDFEVVGIYRSYMDKGGFTYDKFYFSPNTIFIPMAGYPQEIWDNPDNYYMDETYTSLISIIIETGKEKQFTDMLVKNGFPIQDYELTIDDGGYKKLASTLNSMKDNAIQFILLFLIAMFTVFILFVYLYLDKSKKSYIIMRMLGVKKSRVTGSVLSGLLLIGFAGIMSGSLAGGILSSKIVRQAYEQAKESVLGTDFGLTGGQEEIYHFSSKVPLPLILAIAGSITVLLILFTIAGLKVLEGKKDVKVFLS